jgi:hypothetical protein
MLTSVNVFLSLKGWCQISHWVSTRQIVNMLYVFFRGEGSITCLMGLERRNEEAVCVMITVMFLLLMF